MSQVHRTRNIFYAKSIDAAENHILWKLATLSEDFELGIPSNFYSTARFQEFLDLAQERNQILRYAYFPNDCRLQIIPMGSPVHQALCWVLEKNLRDFQSEGSSSNKVLKNLNIGTGSLPIASSRVDHFARRKTPARKKTPDLVISFLSPRGIKFQFTVVLEVGFTETHEDLLGDAFDWLTKIEDVNLVVIVDIKEDRKALQDVKHTTAFQNRARKLVDQFGNEQARARDGSIDDTDGEVTNDRGDGNDDPSSILSDTATDDLIKELETEIDVDDWIGPLSARLEFWELKDETLQQRGESFVSLIHFFSVYHMLTLSRLQDILPRPRKPVQPVIPILDMVPKDQRKKFTKYDLSQVARIDMKQARHRLLAGRRMLALERAREYIRPDLQDADPDFVP